MDQEKNTKKEMKSLELESKKLLEKLQSIQKEWGELVDREKRSKEQYEKIILELNEEINQLKSKNSANERLMVGVYQEKFQCLDENEKLKGELTELKKQHDDLASQYNALVQDHKKLDGLVKSSSSQAIEQDRMEGSAQAHQRVYERIPKTEKVADKSVDELGVKKPMQDMAVKMNEKSFEKMNQNESKGLNDSGQRATDMGPYGGEPVMFGAGKMAPSSSRATEFIEICDSDDDKTPGDIDMMSGKLAYAQTNKRNRTEEFPLRSTPKSKRSICESVDDSLQISKEDSEVLESESEDDDETFSPDTNTKPKRVTELPSSYNHQSKINSHDVHELRKFMGIPAEYTILIPSPEDTPSNPPSGSLCFFTHQLRGGLRFPIPPLFSDIARLFKISLSQLTPNSFRLMAGFAMVVHYLGEEPTARLFHSYFRMGRKDEGSFLYFTPRHDVRFLKGNPSCISGWKQHYFFISSPQPWNFPTIWRDSLPEGDKNVMNSCRDPASKDLLARLNQNPYNVYQLVEPRLLYHFDLSPRRKKLLKPIEEIMEKNLMKEEAGSSSRKKQENSSDKTSPGVLDTPD